MRVLPVAIVLNLCASSLAQTVRSVSASSKSSLPVISAAPSIPGSCLSNCSFQELLFTTSSWSKWITPVTVGTAFVVIDRGTNKTTTTTKFNSATKEFLINGTLSVLGATVTQTATFKQLGGPDVTITWPTPYLGAYGFQIQGTLQYTSSGVAKCTSWPEDPGVIPVPAHNAAAFPKATPQPFDPDDPYGQTYTLVDKGFDVLRESQVATAFPGNPWILAAYQTCQPQTAAAPLQAVSSVGALIATSTQVISAAPSPSTSSTTPVLQPQSAVLPPSTSTPVVPPSSSAQAPLPPPPAPQSSSQAPPAPAPVPQSSSTQAPAPPVAQSSTQAPPPPAQNSAPVAQSSTTQAPPPQNSPIPAARSSSSSSICDAACLIFAGISGQITTTTTPVAASSAAVFSIGGQVLSQGPSSQVVVGSQTLRPGAIITQSGTTFSLAPSGNAIIVNGASTISAGIVPSTPQPITVTANSQSQLVIGSQTVAPTASTVTISGTTYSVGGTGATRTLVPASTSSRPAQYKGAASKQSSSWLAAWLALSLAMFL